MKKLIALALTLAMLCVCAISVSAAETTLPDSDGTAWWVNHTPGVELTAEGVEITFHVKVYDTATAENIWGPLWIVYNGDEAKVNGNGFKEYWVGRGDAWGWGQAPSFGLDPAELDGRFPELMTQAGITQTATFAEGFDWGVYQTTLKAGTDVKMTAKLVDGKVTVVIDLAGVATTTSFPVDTSKPVYLSLFGDQAKLTNIKVTTPDPVAPDAPSTNGILFEHKEAVGVGGSNPGDFMPGVTTGSRYIVNATIKVNSFSNNGVKLVLGNHGSYRIELWLMPNDILVSLDGGGGWKGNDLETTKFNLQSIIGKEVEMKIDVNNDVVTLYLDGVQAWSWQDENFVATADSQFYFGQWSADYTVSNVLITDGTTPVVPDAPSKTGDGAMIVAASVVAVLSAAGVALVLKKKEF